MFYERYQMFYRLLSLGEIDQNSLYEDYFIMVAEWRTDSKQARKLTV